MNCPNCGAPMRLEEDKDSFACDHCKSIYFPEKNEDGVRVLDELAPLSCPLCAHQESTTIPRVPDRKGLERRITCPQCHQLMDTHFYGGAGNVIIDGCDGCDLNWLDSGELMQIARAPDDNS